jgi:hypothetical protein
MVGLVNEFVYFLVLKLWYVAVYKDLLKNLFIFSHEIFQRLEFL